MLPAPWPTGSFHAVALPDHCAPESPFLAHLSARLNVCLPTYLALISSTLGLLSIAAWLFAQLPQIFTNYAVGSTSGLSLFFLVEWCLGDSTNLLGAIFTRQATWQVVVAAYYVFVDLILVGQYAWYSHIKPRRQRRKARSASMASRHSGPRPGSTAEMSAAAAVGGDASPGMAVSRPRLMAPGGHDLLAEDFQAHSLHTLHGRTPQEKGQSPRATSPVMRPTRPMAAPRRSISPLTPPRSLLYLSLLCALAMGHPSPTRDPAHPKLGPPRHDPTVIAGRVLSWSSTLLYLGSRFPQIYKNYVRQSTAGLSAKLFIAAFFGNLFYSSSLLTNPCAWSDMPPYGGGGWVGREGNDRWDWLGRAIPFWLGAAGVLSLDATVGVQFLMYREEIEKEIVRDERGRWRRVTGWMRGWAPIARPFSPGPVDAAEVEPLLQRRGSTATGHGSV